MVLPVGIEPTTSPLPRGCSTTELRQRPGLRPVPPEIHDAPVIGKAGGWSWRIPTFVRMVNSWNARWYGVYREAIRRVLPPKRCSGLLNRRAAQDGPR